MQKCLLGQEKRGKMKFIDLFAGLGGFHVGLKNAGHECVFACEVDEELAKLYEENFDIPVHRDIRNLDFDKIPTHDILCAGFPCQPFSKAGKQRGFRDLQNGDYLKYIIGILKYRRPKFFILENVPNLRKHDREKTWEKISKGLTDAGYTIKETILSPHEFGIPQMRRRLFIVGANPHLDFFEFPSSKKQKTNVKNILSKKPKKIEKINNPQKECLDIWQSIINLVSKEESLPSFPIWAMEFGANYPFEKKATINHPKKGLEKYRGEFGISLKNMTKKEQLNHLPRYSRTNQNEFPNWKKRFIRENRNFYKKYEKKIMPFIQKLKKFPPSWQKFEWNCSTDKNRIIKDHLIQFRASGIRVKKNDYFPALVVTTTQRPIIGWEERYITPNEAARLQSLSSIKLPSSERKALKALGNAVNAKMVELIGINLPPQE